MKTPLLCVALCCGLLSFGSQAIHAASKDSSTCSTANYTPEQCAPTATAMSHNLSIYGQTKMYVAYLNLFRYKFDSQIDSKSVAAATVPAALAPSTSPAALALGPPSKQLALAPQASAPSTGFREQEQAPPADQSDPCNSTALYGGTADAVNK